jgi:hypothetical protein
MVATPTGYLSRMSLVKKLNLAVQILIDTCYLSGGLPQVTSSFIVIS